MKIISGEIPLETVDGRVVTWLYKKALDNGDLELAEKARIRKEQAKLEAKKRNIERTIKARTLRKKGMYQWKQPKSPNYTEYQKQVISGEIPLDKVKSKDLTNIYQKAKLNSDNVLAETIFELINYKHEEWRKKEKRHYCRYYNSIENFDNHDRNSPLPKWEQAILQGIIDFENYDKNDLVKLISDLENIGDEENLKIARQLLSYKQDMSILYVTNDHQEAIDMIEELLQLPICRPNSWLSK